MPIGCCQWLPGSRDPLSLQREVVLLFSSLHPVWRLFADSQARRNQRMRDGTWRLLEESSKMRRARKQRQGRTLGAAGATDELHYLKVFRRIACLRRWRGLCKARY